jgi:hypothetical protein
MDPDFARFDARCANQIHFLHKPSPSGRGFSGTQILSPFTWGYPQEKQKSRSLSLCAQTVGFSLVILHVVISTVPSVI